MPQWFVKGCAGAWSPRATRRAPDPSARLLPGPPAFRLEELTRADR